LRLSGFSAFPPCGSGIAGPLQQSLTVAGQ
jgi:hypothetical protein